MKGESCEMKWTEIDDGFTVEIKGKKFKEFFEHCSKGNFSCCGFSNEPKE